MNRRCSKWGNRTDKLAFALCALVGLCILPLNVSAKYDQSLQFAIVAEPVDPNMTSADQSAGAGPIRFRVCPTGFTSDISQCDLIGNEDGYTLVDLSNAKFKGVLEQTRNGALIATGVFGGLYLVGRFGGATPAALIFGVPVALAAGTKVSGAVIAATFAATGTAISGIAAGYGQFTDNLRILKILRRLAKGETVTLSYENLGGFIEMLDGSH